MMDEMFAKPTEPKPLRDYQAAAIERLRAAMAAGRKKPVLMAPTGAGKTRIAAEVISLARAKNKRVVFCVPALSLIDQTIELFAREGIGEIGVMQADHHMTDASKPVQVCSIQTLERRGFPECDLAVIDEAHRLHKLIPRWMEAKSSLPFIGLSATPWAQGMGKLYDDLIIVATTRELIEKGYLCDFRVFAPSHPDLSKVKIVAGDYHEGQLSEVMRDDRLVGDVVETWRKMGDGRPTICFAVDCAHAQALQWQFQEAGISCGYQDADTSDGERAIIRDHFHAGKLKIVTNVGTLTTGVDWDVRCIILARPTKSEMLFVQMIGRGLRTADGKDNCRILDHSDTHLRLGFVTDIHHETLYDGRRETAEKRAREKKTATPLECANCHFLRPKGVHVCPQCGFAPMRQSEVEHKEGELREMRRDERPEPREKRVIRLHGTAISHEQFFAELQGYAAQKGYSAGWASHKYHEAFKCWPRQMRQATATPSPEVLSWIKSRNIAWAKSRDNPRNRANA